MSKNEVRALDLHDFTATPISGDSGSISVRGVNYVSVHVRDSLTGDEAYLRFLAVEHHLVLRTLPVVVKEVEATFRRSLSIDPGQLEWRATLFHDTIGFSQIKSSVIALDDILQVDVFGRWTDSPVVPKVTLGVVVKIELAPF